MGLTLARYRADCCCLCGSSNELSGEHKIKASLLRTEFGTEQMVIGRFDGEPNNTRLAQSPKSKAFHFTARMCKRCNNERTQAADKEFVRFHNMVRQQMQNGFDPSQIFAEPYYQVGAPRYLNVFRYFAKLLCCHVAESNGPRRLHVARFAMGEVHRNCVWLSIDKDWSYQQNSKVMGPHSYASHGGLVVYGDRKSKAPTAFHSTISIGEIRYTFFSRLTWPERLELQLRHRHFHEWCRVKVQEVIDTPMSQSERLSLALAREDEPPNSTTSN